jgi:hypothetical protein
VETEAPHPAAAALNAGLEAAVAAADALVMQRYTDDGRRNCFNSYHSCLLELWARGGGAYIHPLPVTAAKLKAFYMEYVLSRGNKSSNLQSVTSAVKVYATARWGPGAWAVDEDDYHQVTLLRGTLRTEMPAVPEPAPPIRRDALLCVAAWIKQQPFSITAVQTWALYMLCYWCMLRGRDVIRGNLWVQDLLVVRPGAAGEHPGGVQLTIYLDKNRKMTMAGSIAYALRTTDELDPVAAVVAYTTAMGFDLAAPPPATPFFPHLDDDGRFKGPFMTAETINRRIKECFAAAGVPDAAGYSMSGFRPGGHTDMLVATAGDHQVADGVGRWDTVEAEKRYDRRDATVWLSMIHWSRLAAARLGADAGARRA